MPNLKDEVAAIIRRSLEERGLDRAPEVSGGAFTDVIEGFVAGLKESEFLDARLRSGSPNLIYINIWPRFRPSESMTILTLWTHKIVDKDAVSVIGSREVVFTAPEQLAEYFKEFVKDDVFVDGLDEMRKRYQGAADGMLRCKSLGYLVRDDVAIVIPHEDFVRLAQAPVGAEVNVRAELWKPGQYDARSNYKYLTSSGHVLEIDPHGVREENGTLIVTGKKPSAEQRAA